MQEIRPLRSDSSRCPRLLYFEYRILTEEWGGAVRDN